MDCSRLLIDTDALIAIGNTSLWEKTFTKVGLTTTYTCKSELQNHTEKSDRDDHIYEASLHALSGIEEGSIDLVNTVPKPSGEDAGEESIRIQIAQNGSHFDAVFIRDQAGRERIENTAHREGYEVSISSPAFPIYILYDNGIISKKEFCEATQEMVESEGWTGYKSIIVVWEGIPVDCSGFVDSEYFA
ncbi:hypothetical protein ACEU6E_05610 [Halorutilales archaeon Cl-col2-1]